ncbi:MAG TPA: cytochrome c oxidase assembly protein [Gaiellaceae bacterium]|jgi:cytochrome c oxidase assembly factor CtaG
MGWSFEPAQLVPVAVAAALYAGRALTLRRRGRPVPWPKVLSFAAGLLVLVFAVISPVDSIGEERLFSVHMVQHLMIGDLAPLLIVLGLSGPLLRPLLVFRVVQRARVLTNPLVALPLWAANLWLWHLPRLYDAALRHDAVHALQHTCFFAGGLLLWTALLGLLPGPRWFGRGAQLGALAFAWVAGTALANVFLWSDRPYYQPYVDAPRTWELTPLGDQRAGGGVMLLEMMLVGGAVFVLLGLRWLEDAERRQRRLEQVVQRDA